MKYAMSKSRCNTKILGTAFTSRSPKDARDNQKAPQLNVTDTTI